LDIFDKDLFIMIQIVDAEFLSPKVKYFKIEAPDISRKTRAGQFIILRSDEVGERVPLSVADFDGQRFLDLVVQEVGESSRSINSKKKGDSFLNVAGPLGNPSEIDYFGTVICVAGGIGIAPIYPIARELKKAGNRVIAVMGARNKDLIFWVEKYKSICDEVIITTDDGSMGTKGLVTEPIKEILDSNTVVNRVVAIGPPVMMKFVSITTLPYKVKTIVSLNSIMLDGTGMCGGCRVSVNGESKFVCVDGPEFDGHEVDFDLLMSRLSIYESEEHNCKLGLGGK
jgi:ferredoxin/flavodoxin---NADP+ reductase